MPWEFNDSTGSMENVGAGKWAHHRGEEGGHIRSWGSL